MISNKTGSCPICKKAQSQQYRPFCSLRCAEIDLGKWLNESYVVATDEQPPDKSIAEESDR